MNIYVQVSGQLCNLVKLLAGQVAEQVGATNGTNIVVSTAVGWVNDLLPYYQAH